MDEVSDSEVSREEGTAAGCGDERVGEEQGEADDAGREEGQSAVEGCSEPQ